VIGLERIEAWFASRGWAPFDFQRRAWRAHGDGRSGLIHAATGTGKTYAAWCGPLIEALERDGGVASRGGAAPCRVIWLTPLRALSGDIAEALRRPVESLGLPWTVEVRTGDTPASQKARQKRRLPTALVTTPESLTILLSYAGAPERFGSLRTVVVDEWHELLGTKRGVQTELALARLRSLAPGLRTWGLSATLGNVDEAASALAGPNAPPPVLIEGEAGKRVAIETLIPEDVERYPWAGHLGIRLLDQVIDRVERAGTTLLFTNTRSQAEIWFRELLRARPDWLGALALHHGSIDREIRLRVEDMLRLPAGESPLRCVVCTSSLDLGVDFPPVDQVVQVGSPKGVARLMQRAGRSGHTPGGVSRVVCAPSHAFELVEFAAAQDAIERAALERREPVRRPLDVLAQHLVTVAMGDGFIEDELREEVRSTDAYRDLADEEWSWAMDFVRQGGPALHAYPHYARLRPDGGRWRVATKTIAELHRVGIGTIVSDESVKVKYVSGRALGSIEESFITKLRIGDRFVFAGRSLELVKLHQMTALVRRARSTRGAVPRWNGGKMPLSSQLADAVRDRLSRAALGSLDGPEMEAVRPLVERQTEASRVPDPDELLIELLETRAGHHAFLYPFAGRLAHEGLGPILSLRLSRTRPRSIHSVVSDYGLELLSDEPFDESPEAWRALLSVDGLLEDVLAAIREADLARRRFREIARIAGLTHQGYPGAAKPARHLQASSDMFFDVFREFDETNLLLGQADREVLESQLEFRRLRRTLDDLSGQRVTVVCTDRLTPMAFPLWAESLRGTTVSSETWEQRVRRMVVRLEREASAGAKRKEAARG